MRTTDVQLFWNALGSFWGDFEDKALIEQVWQGYFNVVSGMNQKSLDLRNSLAFRNLPAVLEDKHETFDVIYEVSNPEYSGVITSYLTSGAEGNRYEYNLTPGTASIPTLTYYYYSDSGTLSAKQTLTEGTDYYIQDMERLRFASSPPFTSNENQTHFSGNQLFAETVYRVNPALWGIEATRAGLNEIMLTDSIYNAFVGGYSSSGAARDLVDTEHFKYLVWGIQEALGRKPTVGNIQHLYELVRGLPFAHNSGYYNGKTITGNTHDYTIESPSGDRDLYKYTYLQSGEAVSQFQVLISGTHVYDFVNNYALISGLTDFDVEKSRHIVISDTDVSSSHDISEFSYDSDLLTSTMSNYIPAHLTYEINPTTPSGLFIATWGDDSNNGSRQSPFATFGAAAAVVPSGGTIWYREGTHDGRLRMSYLANAGYSWDEPLLIKAFPGENVRLIESTHGWKGILYFDKLGSSYISVEGFDIDAIGDDGSIIDLRVSGCDSNQVKNCYIHGCSANDGLTEVIRFGSDDNRVISNRIINDTWQDHHGIYTSAENTGRSCISGIIAYNEFSGHDFSIHMNVENALETIKHLQIHHNYIHDSQCGIVGNNRRQCLDYNFR